MDVRGWLETKMLVGSTSWCGPRDFNVDVEAFQAIRAELHDLAADGFVEIRQEHPVSTGGHLVDMVQVKRLK